MVIKMKLWLIRPIEKNGSFEGTAWDPWFDKAFGFVVRAETEDAARQLVTDDKYDCGFEGIDPWLDPSQSSCIELLPEGEEEIIIRDFASA